MQRLVIPVRHSRQSRFGVLRAPLKDPDSSREIDFAVFLDALLKGDLGKAEDEFPLDMLPFAKLSWVLAYCC